MPEHDLNVGDFVRTIERYENQNVRRVAFIQGFLVSTELPNGKRVAFNATQLEKVTELTPQEIQAWSLRVMKT